MAARQPATCPRAVPTGTPKTRASELPLNTMAVARPARPGATSRAATDGSMDQNTPWASAQATRAVMTTA
jgi:hypothetical protein